MAVAITATEQDDYPPRVLVSVTGLTLGDAVTVYRVVGGARTPLRAATADSVADTSFVRTDAELPFGVPVSYLAIVNESAEYTTGTIPGLNANPYFETDAANWNGTGGTIARSTAQAHEGTASGLLTPDGVTATVETRSENVTGIVAGRSYKVSAWLWCPVARAVNANIVWRDSSGVFLSSAGAVSVSLAASTWTPIEVTATAPASTGQAQISISMGSTPPASNLLYIDEAKIYATGTSPVGVTYTLPGGKVAVTDAINGSSAETVILAWDEKAYQRQASVFKVGGRNVVVSGDLGMFEGSIELFTETDSSRENVMDLLANATEGVVQIRQPGGYDGIDSYLAVLNVTERRWSQDGSDPRRVFALQVAEVEGWAPGLEARGTTLQNIADSYTGLTLADLSGDYATLLDITQGDFS